MRFASQATPQASGTTPAASGAIQFGLGSPSVRKIELAQAITTRPPNAARRGDSAISQPMQAFAAGCGSASPGKSVLESTRIEYQIDAAQIPSTPSTSQYCSRLPRISRVCLT